MTYAGAVVKGSSQLRARPGGGFTLITPVKPRSGFTLITPVKPRSGFTLIELMITVAIVGILSAIAIPHYHHMLLRSKRAEVPMLLDAIRTTELGYRAEWGEFTSCELSPVDLPGRVAVSFPATLTTNLDWNALGWIPDGKVYGQYKVEASSPSDGVETFVGTGYADIDGDDVLSEWEATQVSKPEMLTPNIVY